MVAARASAFSVSIKSIAFRVGPPMSRSPFFPAANGTNIAMQRLGQLLLRQAEALASGKEFVRRHFRTKVPVQVGLMA